MVGADKQCVLVATDERALVTCALAACDRAGIGAVRVDAAEPGRPDQLCAIVCDETTFDACVKRWPGVPIIVCARAGDSETAINAIKHGAFDYITGPISPELLEQQIRSAMRIETQVNRPAVYDEPREADDADEVDRIVGQSPAMQDVYKAIGRIARSDINVLIRGESGTGKELVARAVVQHSPRSERPFLAVNCAAIPDPLLESELFGHEKGAFTGADRQRIGKFEQCHTGTLFLDEVGDLPLAAQAKLLRILQEQTLQRVGGSEVIRCDVRIIAATHQPLEALIAERKFRQDLFYRLNVATIDVPPLREREVDVVLLAHYFVERYNHVFGTQIRAFAPETLPLLLGYDWPGNVRELENAIKATLVMAKGGVLRPEFLPLWLRTREPTQARPAPQRDEHSEMVVDVDASAAADDPLCTAAKSHLDRASASQSIFQEAVGQFEAELIREALRRTQGRIAPAARLLSISRTTLRRKMETHAIRITTT